MKKALFIKHTLRDGLLSTEGGLQSEPLGSSIPEGGGSGEAGVSTARPGEGPSETCVSPGTPQGTERLCLDRGGRGPCRRTD